MSFHSHCPESSDLFRHERALLEVGQQIGTLLRTAHSTVRFEAVDRSHLQLAALVVLLEVDHRRGQVGER